ncbi:hypothetical protein Xszus_00703 [Xenorhabdus szentirmaii]|nr:hypothetical protein Xszus_00703 [Xenorhabdus szentirmaii]
MIVSYKILSRFIIQVITVDSLSGDLFEYSERKRLEPSVNIVIEFNFQQWKLTNGSSGPVVIARRRYCYEISCLQHQTV